MHSDLRRPNRTFTIRQLCLEFKCTPRALRFYEDKGLLAPARDGMESQKVDIDNAIAELKAGCAALESRLATTRPDLLPRAADYDQMLRRRLDGVEHSDAK